VDLPSGVTFIAIESMNLVAGKGCGHGYFIILAYKEVTHLALIGVVHVFQ
jgi:hypothetical protein